MLMRISLGRVGGVVVVVEGREDELAVFDFELRSTFFFLLTFAQLRLVCRSQGDKLTGGMVIVYAGGGWEE
jgi:hypothetical protein